MLLMQGIWVRSLVEVLRSHMLYSMAKKNFFFKKSIMWAEAQTGEGTCQVHGGVGWQHSLSHRLVET